MHKLIPTLADKILELIDGLGEWFLLLTVGFIFIPMIYYVLKAFREV